MLLAMPRPILTLPPAAAKPQRVELEVTPAEPRERRERPTLPPPVDFDHVPDEQWDMHRRLENWARSLTSPERPAVSAGFGLFRSSDARATDRRAYGAPTKPAMDPEDAQRIAMLVAELAQDERNDGFRRAKALDWYYRRNCRNAPAMSREMCYSLHGLADCVIAARGWLIERGV